ncbi:hypothetical protein ACFW0C_00675 [Aerococcus sp. NPDC058936]|uniref:hypothetical protein n=1 Tax=Aerococcus sp. NPDC058936 TaxID=3346674 RepID=UPI00366FE41B
MLIRQMKKSETGLLKDYFYKALFVPEGASLFPRSILNEAHVQKYFNHIDLDKDLCFVAEINGQVVGAI